MAQPDGARPVHAGRDRRQAGAGLPGRPGCRARPSSTETFVALKAEVRTWRWAGVPFYLRTGKRLPHEGVARSSSSSARRRSRSFRPRPADWRPNTLIIRLQPEEGMRLEMMTKDPGSRRAAAVADRPRHQLREDVRQALPGRL